MQDDKFDKYLNRGITMKQVRQLGYENFDEFAQEGGLVVFTSAHCPPCRAMKPEMVKYAERGHNIGVVDMKESPDLFVAMRIKALPTVLAIKGNSIKGQYVGGANEHTLLKLGFQADVLKVA